MQLGQGAFKAPAGPSHLFLLVTVPENFKSEKSSFPMWPGSSQNSPGRPPPMLFWSTQAHEGGQSQRVDHHLSLCYSNLLVLALSSSQAQLVMPMKSMHHVLCINKAPIFRSCPISAGSVPFCCRHKRCVDGEKNQFVNLAAKIFQDCVLDLEAAYWIFGKWKGPFQFVLTQMHHFQLGNYQKDLQNFTISKQVTVAKLNHLQMQQLNKFC